MLLKFLKDCFFKKLCEIKDMLTELFVDCGGDTQAFFDISGVDKTNNTKLFLDVPGTTNAYADVGNNNWTDQNLVDALNVGQANAPAPYNTTVFGLLGADQIIVVSGPVPGSINFVSIPTDVLLTEGVTEKALNVKLCNMQSQDTHLMSFEQCVSDGRTGIVLVSSSTDKTTGAIELLDQKGYVFDYTAQQFVPFTADDMFVECSCGIEACILMDAFDFDSGLVQAGDFMQLEIKVDGVSQGINVHDYTTTSDGSNKSTFYTPWIAAIQALSGRTVSLVQDVSLPDNGKPQYKLEYTGDSAQTLRLEKGDVGTSTPDIMEIVVDAEGNITTSTDSYSSGTPRESDPFTPCN